MSIASFPAGTAYTLPLEIMQDDGITPSTAYLNTDTLTATLWAGDVQATVATPTAAWTTCPSFTVSFAATDTSGFTAGVYRLSITVTRSGTTAEIFRDSIELTAVAGQKQSSYAVVTANIVGLQITSYTVSSGGSGYPASSTAIPVTIIGGGGYGALALATSNSSGVITAVTPVNVGVGYTSQPTITVGTTAPLVYCTLRDMQKECSWIQQYMDQGEDEAGFLEQRGEARTWFDGLILSSWPGARVTYIQDGWPSNYGQFTLIANPWLVAGLNAGYLMTSSQRGRQCVIANALYAIALVLRSQMGPTSGIEKYAGYFMRRAQAAAVMCIAELDINGDGLADIAVPLSMTNTRRG
jgi:hypothetical protein